MPKQQITIEPLPGSPEAGPDVIERSTIIFWLGTVIANVDHSRVDMQGLAFSEIVAGTLEFVQGEISRGEHHRTVEVRAVPAGTIPDPSLH